MIEDALTGVEQEDEIAVLPELTEPEKRVWDVVKARIESREISMSFSKIKQFAESPFHFVRYMVARELKQDKATPAMIFGDLVDCLCLTPDEVADRFVIEPAGGAMNSLKGCAIILQFYGSEPVGKMDEQKAVIREVRAADKRRIVTAEILAQANAIRNRVYSNEASRRIMYQFTATQVENEFDAFGWHWKGKFDGEGERLIGDMKMMVSAKPEKAMRTIRDMHYDWQGALYTLPRRAGKKFYNICLDRQLGVSVIHLDNRILTGAWHAVEEMIQHFERCIFEGLDDPKIWYSSYDFFAPRNGIWEYGR